MSWKKYLKLTPEEWGLLSLIFLDEFVKRTLMGIYKTYIAIDTWNFNRTLDRRNQELYESTPKPK
jgi:hypothetical protein